MQNSQCPSHARAAAYSTLERAVHLVANVLNQSFVPYTLYKKIKLAVVGLIPSKEVLSFGTVLILLQSHSISVVQPKIR